jgi:hypothetical protein
MFVARIIEETGTAGRPGAARGGLVVSAKTAEMALQVRWNGRILPFSADAEQSVHGLRDGSVGVRAM